MASKAKTRVKIANGGRNIVLNFPMARLREILPSLPQSDERTLIEQALVDIDANAIAAAREVRLNTVLSIESLAPLGWMLTGTQSALAYGAIREGDFRCEGKDGWTYGPAGAFDREADVVVVMRGAVQAGVMSEKHGVYRLLEPTTDRQQAVDDAMGLEAEWLRALPAKMRKPKALPENEAKGMSSRDQRCYMDICDLEGLPDGATLAYGRAHYSSSSAPRRAEDVVHESQNDHNGAVAVSVYCCDAALRPIVISENVSSRVYGRTGEYRWTAVRHYDPSYDGPNRIPLTTPYDCVLGNVWSVSHNGPIDWSKIPLEDRQRIVIGMNATTFDRRDHEMFPLATKAEADVAAMNFAMKWGIIVGEMRPMPNIMPLPDVVVGVDFAQAA